MAVVAGGLTRPGGLLVTGGLGTTTPAAPGTVVAHLAGTGTVFGFLSVTSTATRFLFTTPTVIEGYGLGARVNGVSVWRVAGQWFERQRPSDIELVDADVVYMGGRSYEVDAAAAAELVTAGYAPVPLED